jgi:hypothetical protein
VTDLVWDGFDLVPNWLVKVGSGVLAVEGIYRRSKAISLAGMYSFFSKFNYGIDGWQHEMLKLAIGVGAWLVVLAGWRWRWRVFSWRAGGSASSSSALPYNALRDLSSSIRQQQQILQPSRLNLLSTTKDGEVMIRLEDMV